MISEQIERLRKIADTGFSERGMARELFDAADTIEELSAKLASANMERSTAYYNDGWIPASERLPEEIFKDYLVCLKNGAIFMAQYSTKNEFRMVCPNAIQYFYKENPVIAWQPLPAPYQPKGEK